MKLFDFLNMSLNQIQRNMRNITALWAKDLGLNDLEKAAQEEILGNKKDQFGNRSNDKVKEDKTKNSIQDIKIHKYLLSLANFIEVERVTLWGYQQQVLKSMEKLAQKKFEDADTKL